MKQVHPELLDLIKTLEADETVKSVDFLTDGDPDEYPSTLKAILDHIEVHGFSRDDGSALHALGYTRVRGDCFCFDTDKGTINTGVDDF